MRRRYRFNRWVECILPRDVVEEAVGDDAGVQGCWQQKWAPNLGEDLGLKEGRRLERVSYWLGYSQSIPLGYSALEHDKQSGLFQKLSQGFFGGLSIPGQVILGIDVCKQATLPFSAVF